VSRLEAALGKPQQPQETTSMHALGKLLQLAGLTVPPITILMQLNDAIKASQMLMMLVASVCLFFIGRIIEGYAK
jgi:hypothetical protein